MVKVVEEHPECAEIRIKVAGVGNAGGKIISRIRSRIQGLDTVLFNTDALGLRDCDADVKVLIGEKTCRGQGTGLDPEKGKIAASEDESRIQEELRGARMVMLIAGLGGGTGTGSSPVIAKAAKELGAIVIAFVATPFKLEGGERIERAQAGLERIGHAVDTYIHLPNEKLHSLPDESLTLGQAFEKIDDIIARTILSISHLVTRKQSAPAMSLDVDFSTIASMVQGSGRGIVGLGQGKGPDRMETAVRAAIEHPLIERSDIMEARSILISISGGADIKLKEVTAAMDIIQTRIPCESKSLCVMHDKNLNDEVQITILATGIGKTKVEVKGKPAPAAGGGELPLTRDVDARPNYELPPALRSRG